MSLETLQLLCDLGVHKDGIDLVWKSIVEDLKDHFFMNPRTRRRPSGKGEPKRPKPLPLQTEIETHDEYMERKYGQRDEFSSLGVSWAKRYDRDEEEKKDSEKKKDRIPVASLIKDEARKAKKENNKARREQVIKEARGDPQKKEQEPEHHKAPKKRQGTW